VRSAVGLPIDIAASQALRYGAKRKSTMWNAPRVPKGAYEAAWLQKPL
jgi:hypothetical protein